MISYGSLQFKKVFLDSRGWDGDYCLLHKSTESVKKRNTPSYFKAASMRVPKLLREHWWVTRPPLSESFTKGRLQTCADAHLDGTPKKNGRSPANQVLDNSDFFLVRKNEEKSTERVGIAEPVKKCWKPSICKQHKSVFKCLPQRSW